MTDLHNDDSFKERLIMVEQQQSHQKQVLSEINDALKEVVKTQHILANQRKEIDRLNKDRDEMMNRLHVADIEDARRRTKEEQQKKMFDVVYGKIVDEIEPQQARTKTYFKLAAGVFTASWGILLVTMKWWLDNLGG